MNKTFKEMDYKERGWLFGTLYGYPECCIKEHVECDGPHGLIVKDTRGEDNPFMGTGFIPCEKCWHRSEEEMTYIINKKRHNDMPPFEKYADTFDDLMKIVEKYYM